MPAKPKRPKQPTNPQLNHHLPFDPRSLGAANEPRVVVGHVGREAGTRSAKAVLAQDGQRQLGLVAGQAQRQVGRGGLVHVVLGQKYRAAKRKRQVVFEDAVARTPVFGIGEVGQAVVTGLGAKREVVDIAAQGAGVSMWCPIKIMAGVRMLRF